MWKKPAHKSLKISRRSSTKRNPSSWKWMRCLSYTTHCIKKDASSKNSDRNSTKTCQPSKTNSNGWRVTSSRWSTAHPNSNNRRLFSKMTRCLVRSIPRWLRNKQSCMNKKQVWSKRNCSLSGPLTIMKSRYTSFPVKSMICRHQFYS
jgi:hypothetical protein